MLPPWVKPEASFDVVYGNDNDALWHVRAVVDGMAVCRRWLKAKNRWHYEVLDPEYFEAAAAFIKPRANGQSAP